MNYGKNFILKLKKHLVVFITIFITTFIQSYWSMYQFRNKVSSSCINCGFFEDVFFGALIFSIPLTTIFLLVNKIKRLKYLNITIKTIFVLFFWFNLNMMTFQDRESSWSTYSLADEIYYTILFSKYILTMIMFILLFLEYKINKSIHLNTHIKLD